MAVDQELLDILICPETRQGLRLASADVLERVNGEIAAGRLRNRGGEAVKDAIVEGLLREDGKVLYVVDDDIPVMLVEESIELAS